MEINAKMRFNGSYCIESTLCIRFNTFAMQQAVPFRPKRCFCTTLRTMANTTKYSVKRKPHE